MIAAVMFIVYGALLIAHIWRSEQEFRELGWRLDDVEDWQDVDVYDLENDDDE